ncbi:MAG TPA: spore germination protein, partial [Paenibacillus sp.]|nr:spore germination protein [Paenibacillus sp.]
MPRRNAPSPNRTLEDYAQEKLPTNLEQSIRVAKDLLSDTDDFIVRRFQVFGRTPAALFYFSDLSNQLVVNQNILQPLMQGPRHLVGEEIEPGRLKKVISDEALIHGECVLSNELYFILDAVLQGRAVVVVDGLDEAFVIGSPNVPKRSVAQPPTEQTI